MKSGEKPIPHSWIHRNQKWLFPACAILLFLSGMGTQKLLSKPIIIRPKALREGGYQYINPVLLCNVDPATQTTTDTAIQNKISSYIAQADESDVAVFYLDLKSGAWAGYNENETFSPASMLKVPTVVSVLNHADEDPNLLESKIYYDGSFNDNAAEYFKPPQAIEPGHSYSVDDLLTYTIKDSDNNALRLLHTIVNNTDLLKVYSTLQIPVPSNTVDFMSPKTYSLFLRVLYNSTYLSRDSSEKILQLMTASDFPEGLPSGVPATIPVAHKFGERQIQDEQGNVASRELHDCGIIYAPGNPYMLCVMTRGNSFDTLTKEIHDISKLVYDSVTK